MTGTRTPVARSAREGGALTGFLLLAFAITWAVWVPRALESTGVLDTRWASGLGAGWTYGPAIAAVLTAAWTGRPALRELGARLTRWRVGVRWWAVVLAGPAVLWLTTAGLHGVLGGGWAEVRPRAVEAGLAGLVPLFLVLALTDGLGEELGWRGFALPRLLRRSGPVGASLLLGAVWAVWHAPLYWTSGAVLEHTPVWLLLVQLPACAVGYTWVFLHTGGSVLPAVALHSALSLFAVSLPRTDGDWRPYLLSVGLQVAVAAVLVATGGLRLPRSDGGSRSTPG
ncbi:CAAX protease self-immunity [Geodermatophilus obscurus]|uniref:CAAX protease self-immunity n=1 Tax=Geodermatophilus obscurus TaxID=1861 RepID=A0A1M7SPZ8_9ACTN|nr:type II CAAX endopeptidase family protein [Geodermatophilus obscurus]SHN60468.1 CAAX protease self-immunity [Geodermatophilus obscurus]